MYTTVADTLSEADITCRHITNTQHALGIGCTVLGTLGGWTNRVGVLIRHEPPSDYMRSGHIHSRHITNTQHALGIIYRLLGTAGEMDQQRGCSSGMDLQAILAPTMLLCGRRGKGMRTRHLILGALRQFPSPPVGPA